MPARSDITPRDLKDILRTVLLFERVSQNPSRYRWRLIGTGLTSVLGENTGKNQLFITPGLLIGRIPIHDRVGMTFGAGYQVAVTHHPAYNNAVIATGRIPF